MSFLRGVENFLGCARTCRRAGLVNQAGIAAHDAPRSIGATVQLKCDDTQILTEMPGHGCRLAEDCSVG